MRAGSLAQMGKGGNKKKKAAAPAPDDNALLEAAIAESNAARAKMEADAAAAAGDAVGRGAAVHPVAQTALGHAALSHQEIVEKLDAVPVFHITGGDEKQMVPTAADHSGTWFFGHADAQQQLAKLREANAGVKGLEFGIEVTPLGTAFALSEGWSPVPPGTLLRLECSQAVVATMPEPPAPLPSALRERFNQRTGAIPIFMVDGFRTAKGTVPACLDVRDLCRLWERETGRPRDAMPEVTISDLRLLVARMLAQADDWRAFAFVAAQPELDFARALGVQSGDEPPPLAVT